ncbi:carboxylesterase/lipase family protein [Rhodococcus jostii]|uniref:Carboxylic ester hydrolase n=1 Tax=Rhodococcus jostii TaxID=132919 RepID=A0A1H5APN8_RHOJO|nr:para-nitrobenzyl esterase [Rhodococcus jostii]
MGVRTRLFAKTTIVLALTAALAGCGTDAGPEHAASRSQAESDSHSLVVPTKTGDVEGISTGQVDQFLGMPYAAPPVGALRWEPPAPTPTWDGIRSAAEFGPRCYQPVSGGSDDVSYGEDCLYLNVYTPAERSRGPLPVLFWIHGGGFMSGSGSQSDGSQIAEKFNTVVVTINYRLGAFGFLQLPGVDDGTAGNFGLLDQQAALRWVQENIASFGGDPSQVTIVGQSAGGHSVCAQLASPTATGLFQGAIIQSGGCPSHSTEEAQADTVSFAVSTGCSEPGDIAHCLRSRSGEELLAASANFGGILTGPLPIVGGPELPIAPDAAIESGSFNDVPIMIGETRDETRGWAIPFANMTEDRYKQELQEEFGPLAQAVADQYPYSSFPSPYGAAYALSTIWNDSSVFYGLGGCRYLTLANEIAVHQPRVFFYRFDDEHAPTRETTLPDFNVGAAHSTQLPYLWGGELATRFTPEQQQLSQTMMAYWAGFAAHGSPTASTQPEWPAIGDGKIMVLDSGTNTRTVSTEQYLADHRCGFWNEQNYNWLPTTPTA